MKDLNIKYIVLVFLMILYSCDKEYDFQSENKVAVNTLESSEITKNTANNTKPTEKIIILGNTIWITILLLTFKTSITKYISISDKYLVNLNILFDSIKW